MLGIGAPSLENDAGSGHDAGATRDTSIPTLPGTIFGNLTPQIDVEDDYLVHAERGNGLQTIVTSHIRGTPVSGSGFANVIDPRGHSMSEKFIAPATGDYLVKVGGANLEPLDYALTIAVVNLAHENDAGSGQDAPDFPPSDTWLPDGTSMASFSEWDGSDVFEINVTAGEVFTVTTSPDLGATGIRFVAPNGEAAISTDLFRNGSGRTAVSSVTGTIDLEFYDTIPPGPYAVTLTRTDPSSWASRPTPIAASVGAVGSSTPQGDSVVASTASGVVRLWPNGTEDVLIRGTPFGTQIAMDADGNAYLDYVISASNGTPLDRWERWTPSGNSARLLNEYLTTVADEQGFLTESLSANNRSFFHVGSDLSREWVASGRLAPELTRGPDGMYYGGWFGSILRVDPVNHTSRAIWSHAGMYPLHVTVTGDGILWFNDQVTTLLWALDLTTNKTTLVGYHVPPCGLSNGGGKVFVLCQASQSIDGASHIGVLSVTSPSLSALHPQFPLPPLPDLVPTIKSVVLSPAMMDVTVVVKNAGPVGMSGGFDCDVAGTRVTRSEVLGPGESIEFSASFILTNGAPSNVSVVVDPLSMLVEGHRENNSVTAAVG